MRAKFPYKKKAKRVGCGIGSGHGKTSCRGQKGQRSRSGYSQRAGFEGGQNPLYRRLPKRGFNNAEFRRSYAIVNLDTLEKFGESEVSIETLQAHGVVKKALLGLKVLGEGELKRAMTVKASRFSESAKQKIEKAGGKAVLIDQRQKTED